MTSVHHLPVEIVSNILVRLPVQELIKIMLVCKSWFSLITDPNFIDTHFNFHKNSNGYLLEHKIGLCGRSLFSFLHNNTCAELSSFEVPFSCETAFFKLVASFNRLICMSDSYHFFGKTIYLWNPCIWKLKILRSSCFARHFEDPIFFAIGVGFDHRSNDLKIVRIMYFGDFYMPIYVEKQPPKVEVYSMATNSWRRIGTSVVGYYAIDKLSTAYVNGAVHWIASKTGEGGRLGNFALSFNFGSAKFGVIMLPKYHNEDFENGVGDSPQVSMTVLRDSLVLIVCCFNNYEIEHCNIWVMREYGVTESWTKKYSIVPERSFVRCLGIINNSDLLMETKGSTSEVVSYDLENLQFKHLGIGRNVYLLDLLNFSESLILYHEGFRLTPRKYLIVEGGIRLGKRKRSLFLQLQKKWR